MTISNSSKPFASFTLMIHDSLTVRSLCELLLEILLEIEQDIEGVHFLLLVLIHIRYLLTDIVQTSNRLLDLVFGLQSITLLLGQGVLQNVEGLLVILEDEMSLC